MLYVDPAFWGRGVGRALMLQALAGFGYLQATLWVLDSNARARRFYEAGGWQPDNSTRTARMGVSFDEHAAGVEIVEVRYRRSIGKASDGVGTRTRFGC